MFVCVLERGERERERDRERERGTKYVCLCVSMKCVLMSMYVPVLDMCLYLSAHICVTTFVYMCGCVSVISVCFGL